MAEDAGKLFDDRRGLLPLLPGCSHTFIGTTLTQQATYPLGWIMGDLFVRTDSAGGRHKERRIPIPDDHVLHVGGLHHFDLLDHPKVYELVRDALKYHAAQ